MLNKFIIKEIKIVGVYEFNLPLNKECTICRNNLNMQSIYNQDKGIDSTAQKGKCGHSFHNECINKWVVRNRICPICSEVWCSSNFFSHQTEIN